MRVLSLWIVVYLFQRRIEEEIWLVIFWTFLLKRRIIGGNSLIRTRKNEFVLSFQYVLVVVDVALYSLYSWMVVYNTESACVFRDFLITFFLSFAGFFFIFSEVALLEERSPKLEKRYLFWRRANYSRVSFERYNIFLRSRPSIHGRIARLARICAPEIILHIRG